MTVAVKRIYEPPARDDGTRVLVDRLWPRGLSKNQAAIDYWFRDLAPSDALRKWFHSESRDWAGFRKQYLKELAQSEAGTALAELYRLAGKRGRLTLLFASKNEVQNNATVLKDLLSGMRKPPTGTGPTATRVREARRSPRK